jgi:hypothetical protein
MAHAKALREQAERFRQVAERATPGGKVRSNPYLTVLADHYEREADLAEARSLAGDKPRVSLRQPGALVGAAGAQPSPYARPSKTR